MFILVPLHTIEEDGESVLICESHQDLFYLSLVCADKDPHRRALSKNLRKKCLPNEHYFLS